MLLKSVVFFVKGKENDKFTSKIEFPMRYLFPLLCAICLCSCQKKNKISLDRLQVEHLSAPMGIDTPKPRFSWTLSTDTPELSQKEYHIYVAEDSLSLVEDGNILWDEHGVASDNLIVYKGRMLKPFTKYYWGISVVGNNGEESNLAISHFETGMMSTNNWKGKWITDTEDVNLKPAPYFRKEIALDKKVVRARAYIVAAGLYELYINGQKVDNHRLDPVYTRFDRRNVYVTYDVTDELRHGKAAIGVLLGNGWYNHQSTAVWNFDKAGWRHRPRFCLNIRLTYQDGSTEIISTDKSWKTALSPVVFNSIYTGEHYNALLEQKGWDKAGFNDSSWSNSMEVKAPSNTIVAQAIPPIRNIQEITPVSMRRLGGKHYIFDLGQNISGVTKLQVSGQIAARIWVSHAEQLDSLDYPDMSNIDVHYRPQDNSDPFQTDIYTLSGGVQEVFMPKFNYKGFQYVEVKSNTPIDLQKNDLKGEFMHTDVKPIGSIHTSNETINKIWQATNNSYLSNLFGYPTDCPQREKNGWTGDAHINIETGLYNFDAITVYEKWMQDHKDEQQSNGVLPSIIPTWGGWGYDWGNGPDWTSTIAIIPWELYRFYGDDKALQMMYGPMKKYVDYITSISYDGGLTDWGLGDWVPVKSVTPKELTSSIYYYVDANILAKTAKHFGKEKDYQKYAQLANNIKKAINQKYLDPETGIYGNGYQTELSAPLYWGIVPDSLKPKVAKQLAEAVLEAKNHIDVGLLGTKTILGALSQNGHADLAYKVASQETYPSWGWWIKNGATTLYENWNIDAASDISKNHIMFGAISAWFYKSLGGILPDENAPGFKHIILKPNMVSGLENFEARFQGPQGEILSRWETSREGIVKYEVIIPNNSTATLYLNANKVEFNDKISENANNLYTKALNPGHYTFLIYNN
ncbi:alpha-L-rhamnosidase [Galbibacter pacificus]|uniref:alpha-L-rhamnosidase n=1 Tax=Galbibacter pacificus TaxID=2996052 RepID=A0ABT6FN91_9FLAO|nr:alpha-L-rhamnosidase [Galbibacter pacificus]MDG3581250.1 family 78 glycoside hydrolase catalytic domain [Galbibacter pacificus]MDG3584728.1 family 78 glycoside hydrolase catalytic domain [Galbibacter pacificus]